MFRKLRPKLTYSNVMVTILAFIVLGGGAYAATAARNSVKSSSIKDGQVKTADVRNGAITKPKLGSSANSAFLSSSRVQRVAFLPTGCGTTLGTPPACSADVVNFSGLIVHADCYDTGIPAIGRFLHVTLTGATDGVNTNLSYIRDFDPNNGTARGNSFSGDDSELLDLNTNSGTANSANAVGTIVIQRGTAEKITIPFHAFLGDGVNCVFEGTATRA